MQAFEENYSAVLSLYKKVLRSAIALVTVAAILMLGTLAAISTTKQAFAKPISEYKKVWYIRENGKTYQCKLSARRCIYTL